MQLVYEESLAEKIKELEQENRILKIRIESIEKQRCRKEACPHLDGEPVYRVKVERDYLRKEVNRSMDLMDFATKRMKALEGENNYLRKQLYGAKSEKQKTKERKGNLSPADKEETKRERGAQDGHQGHGRKIPENLPVVEEFYELPEEERYCKRCGLPVEELSSTEDSYEIGVRKTYFLRRNRKKKYKKTCSCPNPIITAPAPSKIIPKGKFTPGFWSKVILDKYLLSLPLQRQVFQMKLFGLDVSKGTLVEGLKKLSNYLLPLYNLFREEARLSKHWHADETGWFIFVEAEDKKGFKWWLWVYVIKEKGIVFYVIDRSRSGEVAKKFFGKDAVGIANVDRYVGYKKLGAKIQLAYCWFHVRRDFIKIQSKYPEDNFLVDWAGEWIDDIAKLYLINEKRLAQLNNPDEFSIHQDQLVEKLEEMKERSRQKYEHPEQIKVMESLKKHWKGLTIFVERPDVPMDNNLAERCFKTSVLGRKNYYGNHSEIGGEMAAVFFTMTQSYLFNGLDPGGCLEYYFEEYAKSNGPPKDLRRFLPQAIKEKGPPQLKIPP
ncbi:MAG: hypothetical protein DDT40_01370 [candidate division WS2 bacterium]|nr:hypothetical protein [Candidatus Psychracetigena formicireducens]